MSFMKPQIMFGEWWRVETTSGIEFVDASFIDKETIPECCEGEILENPELIEGYGARLSAPGYLDCTSWSVHDTEQDAENELREMYPDLFKENK